MHDDDLITRLYLKGLEYSIFEYINRTCGTIVYGVATAIFILIILFIYFLPSCIAYKKYHPHALPIFLLNLFLGFSYIGWVISLIWCFLFYNNRDNEY